MKAMIVVMGMLLLTSFVPSHQDIIIRMDKDGTLNGFPEQFMPASFDSVRYVLRIGRLQTQIPECVRSYFAKADINKFTFGSSWYHDKNILPYYLDIDIWLKDSNVSFSLLYDLERLELFRMERVIIKGSSMRSNPILFWGDCKKQLDNSVTTVRD